MKNVVFKYMKNLNVCYQDQNLETNEETAINHAIFNIKRRLGFDVSWHKKMPYDFGKGFLTSNWIIFVNNKPHKTNERFF